MRYGHEDILGGLLSMRSELLNVEYLNTVPCLLFDLVPSVPSLFSLDLFVVCGKKRHLGGHANVLISFICSSYRRPDHVCVTTGKRKIEPKLKGPTPLTRRPAYID